MSFIIIGGIVHPYCSPCLLKFSMEIRQNKLDEASQGCKNVVENKDVFDNFYHFRFAHKQVLKFCIYVYGFVFRATSKIPDMCSINCSMKFSKNSLCLIRT